MNTPPPMPALRVAEPSPQPERESIPAPGPAPVPVLSAGPSPALREPASETPPLEALLLRFRLITPAQLDEAQRASLESGRELGEIVVERGWMTEDQLERIRSYAPSVANPRPEPMDPGPTQLRAAPVPTLPDVGLVPPAPVVPQAPPAPLAGPIPAPIAEVVPMAEPSTAPTPAADTLPQTAAQPAAADVAARVLVHLTNGERVEAGRFPHVAAARARAEEIVKALSDPDGTWPFYGGRYLRPDAIVSVDLELVHAS